MSGTALVCGLWKGERHGKRVSSTVFEVEKWCQAPLWGRRLRKRGTSTVLGRGLLEKVSGTALECGLERGDKHGKRVTGTFLGCWLL